MKLPLVFVVVSAISRMACGQAATCPQDISHISISSGSFSSQPGVSFHLRHFIATLVPVGKKAPACNDRMTVVSHGEIFIDNDSLTKVFNEKLGSAESKIKGFRVENGEGKVTLSGRITKMIPIAFTVEGPVTTDGTLILLSAKTLKADGIPIKGLLAMVGQHMNSVLGIKGMDGITVDQDVLSFSPERVAHLKGHIESVETTSQGLTLHMSMASKKALNH
jgi:hypothetical protein